MTKERVLKLPVLEIFGPTFQGEGRAIGQKTMFCPHCWLRLPLRLVRLCLYLGWF
ncbi:organic radical activating enzyme [Streptococcus infantis SK1302]|uniref:Organic radical activating enzyme n=1 Tax=Streptococcus infantis SK1302 TaxID=871237 RepID=A0ABN0B6Q6_9STRE|nr:organic radical activating enzyme [Streptococcus infantis SK1302]